MKKLLLIALICMQAAAAQGIDIAKAPVISVEKSSIEQADRTGDRRQVALVCIHEEYFTDLTDIYLEVLSGDFGWDVDVFYNPTGNIDYSVYSFVFVTTSDHYNLYSAYPHEIQAWAAYMDASGPWCDALILIGQDFLYGAEEAGLQFVQDYMGVTSVYQDWDWGMEGWLDWWAEGWHTPLDGMSGSMQDCFFNNPWFADRVEATYPLVTWDYPNGPYEPVNGGSLGWQGAFSTVEFACEERDTFRQVLSRLISHWDITPVENTSFSVVKSLY